MSNVSDASSSQYDEDNCDSGEEMYTEAPAASYSRMCKDLRHFSFPKVRIGDCDIAEDEDGIRTVSEVTFVRDFVGKSVPCVIVDLIQSWPAMEKWQNDDYLFQLDRRQRTSPEPTIVTVALTPNGRADCITDVTFASNSDGNDAECERIFMAPAEHRMSLPDLWDCIRFAKEHALLTAPLQVDLTGSSTTRKYRPSAATEHCAIPYCQLQNNCLETEFQHLRGDVTDNVKRLGERLFGNPCDAANVWIGTGLSVSSMHQDWYENLYAVVRGVKEFLMIPPWESALVRREKVRSATYVLNKDEDPLKLQFDSKIQIDSEEMEWIGVDLEDSPEHELVYRNPEIVDVHAVKVEVSAGEVLFLPAMWLHRVAQREARLPNGEEDTCIVAVNYWYDMQMDGALYHLCQHVAREERKKLGIETMESEC